MRYQCIISDPPWKFGDKLRKMKSKTKRSAESQYAVMTAKQIATLDVPSLVDPAGCVLALWVPGTLLPDGLMVMGAWGFTYKSMYVWVKTKKRKLKLQELADPNNVLAFGMGRLFRQTHEVALIGTAGTSVYPSLRNRSQRSVALFPNHGHSTKPPTLHLSLEKMFPESRRMEMFARRVVSGWTCIGDAVTGKDISESIQELAAL